MYLAYSDLKLIFPYNNDIYIFATLIIAMLRTREVELKLPMSLTIRLTVTHSLFFQCNSSSAFDNAQAHL